MALNYAYNFAQVDPDTKMCIGVLTTSNPDQDPEYFVEIPVYDPEYCFKFYINGEWYEDAEGTIPWTSALL